MKTAVRLAGITLLLLVVAGRDPSAHGARRPSGREASTPAAADDRPVALLERTGLAEFAPATDVTDTGSSSDRHIAQAMQQVLQRLQASSGRRNMEQALRMLARIIKTYPRYGDARWLRAQILLEEGHQREALTDLTAALQLEAGRASGPTGFRVSALYALRARVHLRMGDDRAGMSDLEAAVLARPDDTDEIFNAGQRGPGRGERMADLASELHALASRYPRDYRPFLFLGLYYAARARSSDASFAPALAALEQAAQRNDHAAIVPYEIGILLRKRAFWSRAAALDRSDLNGMAGGYRERTRLAALEYFKQAGSLQPTFEARAEAQTAATLSDLKRYRDALGAYDRLVALKPHDGAVYNDRGVVKLVLGDNSGAIDDFTQAIQRKVDLDTTYENRAAAEAVLGRYREAVADYSRTIGLRLRERLRAMPIAELRALYPELHDLSDPALVDALRQKYDPGLSRAEFARDLATATTLHDSVLADSYATRGDIYLRWGRFKQAAADYARAHLLFPAERRWRVWREETQVQYSIDARTIDVNSRTPSLWLRRTSRDTGAYTQEHDRFDCEHRQVRTLASRKFTWFGHLLSSEPGGTGQPVGTTGIFAGLYEGVCR